MNIGVKSLFYLYCRGQVPAEAEANFLKKAASLDTYGVDPHKVKVSISRWKSRSVAKGSMLVTRVVSFSAKF